MTAARPSFIAWLAQIERTLIAHGTEADAAAADILGALPELSQAYDAGLTAQAAAHALDRIPA